MKTGYIVIFALLALSLLLTACEPEEVEPELTPVNEITGDPPPTPTLVPTTQPSAPVDIQADEGEPEDGTTLPDTGDPSVQAGLELFQESCAACHQSGGEGVPGVYPALDGNVFVTAVDPIPVTMVIIEGRGGMPAFYGMLEPGEVADVVTYIRGAWGNPAEGISEAEAIEAWQRTNLPLEDDEEGEDEDEDEEEEENENED
jgi:cytochrome c6